MSEEDRRAIEMALREEEEAMGGGGGMAYDGGRDGALGMTRAQRNELPGGGHWSSKRYQRSIGNPNKYKLDAIGRKPEGLMPVEGKFVNRTISLTRAQEHPDRIRARERKASDVVESAQSILCVFEETLGAPDKDDDLCGILAEQAKESSSSLVALLTEEDGDMDETLTSKLIELSEKLNVAIQKYERIGNDRAPQHPRRRQQRRRISSSNNNDKCNTTYSGYHPMEEVLTKPRFLHPTRSLRTHRRVFHLFDQPRPVMKRSTRFSVTVFRRTLRHNNRVGRCHYASSTCLNNNNNNNNNNSNTLRKGRHRIV